MSIGENSHPEDTEETIKEKSRKVTVSKEQLNKEKRKILSQILWLLLLVNFFVGIIAFAIVYEMYIPTFEMSLLFSLSVIMGVLLIEGPVLIFLGLVTKERNYADILMKSSSRRTMMMMSTEAQEREIELFNQLVIFTKKLFLVLGIIFTVFGFLYFLLPIFLKI